jgi:hypothetical protein
MVYVNEKLTPVESNIKKYTRPGRKQVAEPKQNNVQISFSGIKLVPSKHKGP